MLENDADLQFTGTVTQSGRESILVSVDNILEFGNRIHSLPEEGTVITIRLTGERPPQNDSKILITVKEKPVVGESSSAYLLVEYTTLKD